MDVLSIDWPGMIAFALPPPVLSHKVVQKDQPEPIQNNFGRALLAADAMVPNLVTLAVAEPVRLPPDQKLLSQVLGSGKLVFHTNPTVLNLHAWLIDSHPSALHVHSQE